ncbi:hypothetical protein WR25_03986 isoform B [Diploscapter pachys]|uniref:Uncharacterized protein n=1 Tax=Diploscapter pachys TaxID=2018661 RepID=A0A2A2KPU0_9BILA|nr:hypothetical protein WR25_03986 isoform B [Diploscapter pachys]
MTSNNSRSMKSQLEAETTKAVVGTVARTVTNALRGSTQSKSEKEFEVIHCSYDKIISSYCLQAEMNFKMCELEHRNKMQMTEMNHKHEIELQKIALEHKKLDIYAEERRQMNEAQERGRQEKI